MTALLPRRALLCGALLIASVLAAGRGDAQPASSFTASCAQLRQALTQLQGKEGELTTIAVEGALTMVRSDGALVYLALCSAPDPQVLCVTYAENGSKVGDRVVVAGSYERAGPNHVKLDPCLHHPPGEDAAR